MNGLVTNPVLQSGDRLRSLLRTGQRDSARRGRRGAATTARESICPIDDTLGRGAPIAWDACQSALDDKSRP